MFRYSWEDDQQQASDPAQQQKTTGAATPASPTTPAPGALDLMTRNTGFSGGNLWSGDMTPPPSAGGNTPPAGPDFSKLGLDAPMSGAPSQPVGADTLSRVGAGTTSTPNAPTVQTQPVGGSTTPGAPKLEDLSRQAQALSTIADPAERARQQDQIARSVAQTLQGAGHTVKWQGDTLMVDGRPYVIGGTAQPTATPGGTQQALDRTNSQITGQPSGAVDPAAAAVDPNRTYDPNDALNQVRAAFSARFPRGMSPEEEQALMQLVGYTGGPVSGAMLQQALDAIGRYSGNINDPWGNGGGGGGGGGTEEPAPSGTPEWRAQWSYTPGEVTTDDLEGLNAEEVLRLLGPRLQPGQGAGDRATEDLVLSILQNPESMSPEVIAAMKARSKDEIAEMGRMEDEALRNYGFDAGITDSNWLRSEQLASTRDRQNALVSKNRDIEIDAARTNFADRQQSAGLGMAFSDQRFGQALASQQEQRQAVALAQDTGLRAAAVRGDRMALREQINAKAAELGLDADRVALQYTLGLMDDLTKRYGIDVGRDVDMARLASADRQFIDELALRYAQLDFQYAELAKRDEWAQLDAGVRLATGGFSAGYDPDLADGKTDPRDRNRNGIPDNEE